MAKLYEITKDYIGFLDSGLPADELNDCLESIEDAFEDKANNIMAVTQTLQEDVTAIDNQIKRLQERKKAIVNNQESLKEYLRHNMEMTGISKIKHPLFTVTLSAPGEVVKIVDEKLLSDEFVTVKTTVAPDKIAIKKAIKSGVEVLGACLVSGKSRLTIK